MKLLNKFLLTLLCAATISSCYALSPEQQEQVNRELLDSIWKGYLPGAQQALTAGADINTGDGMAWLIAVEQGHVAVVQWLIEHGADIHARNDYVLGWAVEQGHVAVVQRLVEQGANIHVYDDYALRAAASKGHLAVVQYLVEQGADIHAENDDALRAATCDRRLPVAVYLVRQGADRSVLPEYWFNLLNQYICSELQTALATNKWHQVEELLSAIPIHELPGNIQQKIKDLLVPAVQEKFIYARLVLFARTELTNPQLAFKTLSCIVGPRTYAAVSYFVKKDTHEITQ